MNAQTRRLSNAAIKQRLIEAARPRKRRPWASAAAMVAMIGTGVAIAKFL